MRNDKYRAGSGDRTGRKGSVLLVRTLPRPTWLSMLIPAIGIKLQLPLLLDLASTIESTLPNRAAT